MVNHIKGYMALAHNGALTNARELREELELRGSIFHMTSDSEVISYVITRERLSSKSIEEAVSRSMDVLKGAYSMVVMSPRKLIAARGSVRLPPAVHGQDRRKRGVRVGELRARRHWRDVRTRHRAGGDRRRRRGRRPHRLHARRRPAEAHLRVRVHLFCPPDSVIDGSSVHTARVRAGSFLALEHPVQADVVIGVPDSGLDAAIGFSRQSGIPYGIGFIKNKYIGRTFIQPTQADRENKVRIKLNVVSSVVRGKRVVLVDDSIVRGTTSARIVKMLREAGATEVHMRSSAPAFTHPCYFGTDIDSCDRLIACRYPMDQIKDIIGVDSLGFLSVDSAAKLADNSHGFCTPASMETIPAIRRRTRASVSLSADFRR